MTTQLKTETNEHLLEVMGNIKKYYDMLNENLNNKESLVMQGVDHSIHHSYTKMWTQDSNAIFRAMVLLEQRKQRMQKRLSL
jgi:hypothetical protein